MISFLGWLSLLLLSLGIQAQTPTSGVKKKKCYDEQATPIRCVPGFMNAAFHGKVTSNNTCGTPRSTYCVQTLSTGQRKECQDCDSSDPALSHPSIYITDIKDDLNYSWWQSDSLYTLLQNKIYDPTTRRAPVFLDLNLGKTFEVVSIRLRFRSLRPESMAIFKQTTSDPDGPWIPYQYYSRSCNETYGKETDGIVTRDNLQDALCTAKYSQLVPIHGGEVLFRTLYNRPGKQEIEELPALQEWIRAYSLRFNLTRLNTFGDDIFGDRDVLRSYYYAIIDLTVVGKCDCNGHASECDDLMNNTAGRQKLLVCKCEHFTDGVDCEKCLPFYNNKPWAKATSKNANPCEVCNCNGLADVCDFDAKLYRDTGQGGRCRDCRNDTGGPHCERCKENYHRENDNEQCKPCNCNPIGSQSLQCWTDGRCYCKQGVTGDKCDRCRPNYYGFSENGCRPCQCSVLGTRADSFQCGEDGRCTCKKNVIGKNCDKCRPGYFALEVSNPYGCRQCFCYGHSNDCKSAGDVTAVNLTSVFRVGVEEWTALNSKGDDVTRQLTTWDQPEQLVRVTSINQDSIYLSAPEPYLKDKKTSYARVLAFRFKVADTTEMKFTDHDIILEAKDNLRISTSLTAQGNPVPTRSFQRYQFRLHEDPSFDWMPQLSAYKFQRLLNDLTAIKIRMTYSDQGTGFIDDISLEFARTDDNAVSFVNWMEQCTCPPNYVGLSCDECRDGHKHETVNGSSYDRCVRCECNNHADKCDPDTGKCVCLDNTVGDDCSRCEDGFYGNPTIGTKDDCKPCPCVVGNQCIQIGNKVKCVCPEGYQGDLCDKCIDGFYGDPAGRRGPKTPCVKCDCNGNIDTNAVFNCDSETGDCIKCIHNTRNGPLKQCELCKVGFYGDATTFPKPGCKACNCHENGTFVSSTTDTSQPLPCDQQGKCICRPNVLGDKCDQCKPEFWNINSKKGCEACVCDSTGSLNNSCNVDTGQCFCKPGVGGRTCDQCLPDHYKFSPDGCKACNCNVEGSLRVSCDDNGNCVCRPGVLGVKCDQCGENRFNLSAGCTRCPPCYDELKAKVDVLRELLKNLNTTIGTGTTEDRDEEFIKDMDNVKQQLLALLEKVEDTSVNDKELMKRLDLLNTTLVIIESSLAGSLIKAKNAQGHQTESATEVDKSMVSIGNSWELVKKIQLNTSETEQIIDDILNSVKNWSESTVVLREKAKEVRDLANGQWSNVQQLLQMAKMARNTSRSAKKTLLEARRQQNETIALVNVIENNLNDVKSLGEMALGNGTTAKDVAKSTGDKADALERVAKIPLENVDVNGTKEESRKTTKDAKDVQEEAKRLSELAGNQGGSVDYSGLERKKTIIYETENRTNDLLQRVKEANKTAHFAILNGTKALKEARETLETLQNFNDLVNKSKTKAEKAKLSIVDIERLIASANNNTGKAIDEIGNAVLDSEIADTKAKEASSTSEKTDKEAVKLKKRADGLKVPDDSVYNATKKAEEKFNEYEKRANESEIIVKNATKTANDSKDLAVDVMKTIQNATYAIVELSASLSDLPDLDYDLLEKLEQRTAEHMKQDGLLDVQIKEIKQREVKITQDIKKYELDLSELEEALKKLEKNRKIIPDTCMKEPDTPN